MNYLYRCNIKSFCTNVLKYNTELRIFYRRVGGSIPIVWAYFGEFQPKSKRGMMLSCLATFWMVGNVTVAGMICYINSLSWTNWNIYLFLFLLRLKYSNLMVFI